MPATAAIDNETLDHLLSVVDDSHSLRSIRRLSKRGRERRWNLRAISVGGAAARSWRECGMSKMTPAQLAAMLDGPPPLQAASRSASESDSLWVLSKACGLRRHSPM